MRRFYWVLILLLSTNFTYANSAPSRYSTANSGKNIGPVKGKVFYHHKSIQLLKEKLHISLHKDYYQVKIDYIFKNFGADETVKMAFPYFLNINNFKVKIDKKTIKRIRSWQPYKNFFGWFAPETFPLAILNKSFFIASDKSLLKWPKKGSRYYKLFFDQKHAKSRNYKFFKCSFKKRSLNRVRIEYKASYGYEGFLKLLIKKVSYIIETGKYWKGKIKKLDIQLDLNNYSYLNLEPMYDIEDSYDEGYAIFGVLPFISPKNYSLIGKTIRWSYTNIEPTNKTDINMYLLDNKNKGMKKSPIEAVSSSMMYPSVHSVFTGAFFQMSGPKKYPHYGYMYYSPYRMLDKTKKLCWAEGVKGAGIGEWVEFKFKKSQRIKKIGLINGYAKSKHLYKANNRVKKAALLFDDKIKFIVNFADNNLEHQFFKAPRSFKKLRIVIKEVYPGTDLKGNDTCLQYLIFK